MKRDLLPVLFGVIVSTILSGTLVIAGLKAGITPGVSPLVILCAWGAFAAHAHSREGRRFLNLTQVAGSAGMAVTAGVIFTAPLVQILFATRKMQDPSIVIPGIDVPTLILLSIAGSLMGFGFVGLATKKFLTDPTLPAPEARACEAMIEAAAAGKDARPKLASSLFLGLGASFLAPLVTWLGFANEKIHLLTQTVKLSDKEEREFSLDLPFSPIYIGIGGLLTLATALLVAGGSFLRLVGDFALTKVPLESAMSFPDNSMRWVGGGAMTVAVAYSLVKFLGARTSKGGEARDESLLVIDHGMRRLLILSIAGGAAIIISWLLYKEGALDSFGIVMSLGVLVMATLMVTLGAILSLQIGSSASPVSGTVFVTTLVLCVLALALGRNELSDVLLLTPLLVAACVAVCAANDSSQDYKTMQLCGVRVQDGFLAQFLGLLGGCIVVPLALYIAHQSQLTGGPVIGMVEGKSGMQIIEGLGSAKLTAPQGQMFSTLIDGLLLEDRLPWAPIFIGLVVGVLAVFMEIFASKRKLQLPAMALAVGIYLPAYLGIGILVGAFFRWLAEGKNGKQRNESILAAAGLITGAAAIELVVGGAIVLSQSGWFDFSSTDELKLGMTDGFSERTRNIVSLLGILGLCGVLYYNSLRQRNADKDS